jgi:hypothetical protein
MIADKKANFNDKSRSSRLMEKVHLHKMSTISYIYLEVIYIILKIDYSQTFGR